MSEIKILGKYRRRCKKVKCSFCNKSFWRAIWFVRSKNYCSCDCASKGSRKRKEVTCWYCKKRFFRSLGRLKRSKSGIHYCSRLCKDKAQRIVGGCKASFPSHYLAGGMPSLGIYRRYALRTYGEKCELCGYNKYKEALEVHHIDKNRRNNNIKNLMVLCPNCHRLLTLKIGIIVKRKFIVIKTKRSQPCFEGYGN